MKGVVLDAPGKIRVADDLPSPKMSHPRDSVVRVTLAAICGTDLLPYRVPVPGMQPGNVMGHEFVGVVEETDTRVTGLKPGDRVVASDLVACGDCWECRQGFHPQCESKSFFGCGTTAGAYYPGGQAEAVRVPYSDQLLFKLPDEVSDEQAVFVGDILATGMAAALDAGCGPGDTVAVIGCGPVGMCAILAAQLLGAATVIAIDPNDGRRKIAEGMGCRSLASGPDTVEKVRELTRGRGADAVLECVGSDDTLTMAIQMLRPRGTVSAVGFHHSTAMPFNTGLAWARELTIRFTVGNPMRTRDRLLSLLAEKRLDPTPIVSHRLSLDEAAKGYDLFDKREATKVVLLP